mgnify:CR=1 FL=1
MKVIHFRHQKEAGKVGGNVGGVGGEEDDAEGAPDVDEDLAGSKNKQKLKTKTIKFRKISPY